MHPSHRAALLTTAATALRSGRDTRQRLARGLKPGHPVRQRQLDRAIEALEEIGGRLRSEVGVVSHRPGPHEHERELRQASLDVQAERHSLRRMRRR